MATLRLRTKYTTQDFFLFIALFCVSSFALLEHSSISISLVSRIKLPLLYMGGLCLLTQLRLLLNNLLKKRYFFIFVTLILLCGMLLITMLSNMDPYVGSSPARATIRLILFLVELIVLVVLLAETGRSTFVLNFLFRYMLVLTIINDFLFLSRLWTFRSGKFETYIVGTKFSVAYLHMNLLAFWVMRRRKVKGKIKLPKWRIALLAVFAVLTSARIDCMTGIVGSVALVVLLNMMETQTRRRKLQFTSPVILCLFLIASVVFSFIAQQLTTLPGASYIIEDILGRDVTLTGRINIYLQYVDKVSGHWLTGFGYGNGNAASVYLFGYENVQNAILQWVLQVGVFATGLLLVLMLQFFHYISKAEKDRISEAMPLIALIYVYVIMGTIETTFNMNFIMWFAIVFMMINEKKAPVITEEVQ